MSDPIIEPYLRMALNNSWANATLYGALNRMSEADFAAERPGFFPSLKRVMNHIHEVDLYYLDALEAGGLGRSVFDRDDIGTPTALGAEQLQVDMRLAMYCKELTPEILSGRCQTERKGSIETERRDALLLHLFQHQIHHRGQAHTMVLHAGITPPQLDDFHLEFGRAPSAKAYWGA